MQPLLCSAAPDRPIFRADGQVTTVSTLMQHAAALARQLPDRPCLINLCERRYHFLVAFCAALLRGQTNLLPASRAQEVVNEVLTSYEGSYRCDDPFVQAVIRSFPDVNADSAPCDFQLADRHIAVIGFTSGSTGRPQPHPKRWGSFLRSNAINASRIRECLAPKDAEARPWIVATVPSQHMYGMETSVLLPLAGDMAVHGSRPLFPADVAAALAEVPAPRVLVSTPVHLRALVASGLSFPQVAAVVSATAPLDAALAHEVERLLNTTMLETFGSTETCIIASRYTAREESWRVYPEVTLEPGPHSTLVKAPWFDAPTTLQDVIELRPDNRFVVRGRNTDMVEVAGKRASLADLTRRLLNIAGVEDAVVFQPDAPNSGPVRRVAALVVSRTLSVDAIVERLKESIDPVFIPRPLVLVSALPRNELGKLPRERLIAAVQSAKK